MVTVSVHKTLSDTMSLCKVMTSFNSRGSVAKTLATPYFVTTIMVYFLIWNHQATISITDNLAGRLWLAPPIGFKNKGFFRSYLVLQLLNNVTQNRSVWSIVMLTQLSFNSKKTLSFLKKKNMEDFTLLSEELV